MLFEIADSLEELDVQVIRLQDPQRCDRLITDELSRELLSFVQQQEPERVLIEFDRVTCISAAVVSGLLALRHKLGSDSNRLKLSGMDENVRSVFRVLRLDSTVFDIYESADDAMDAYTSPQLH